MLDEHVDPDEAPASSEGRAVDDIGLALLQVVGDEGAVDALRPIEVHLLGQIGPRQAQHATHVLRQVQQPVDAAVGKVADGRLSLLRHIALPDCAIVAQRAGPRNGDYWLLVRSRGARFLLAWPHAMAQAARRPAARYRDMPLRQPCCRWNVRRTGPAKQPCAGDRLISAGDSAPAPYKRATVLRRLGNGRRGRIGAMKRT